VHSDPFNDRRPWYYGAEIEAIFKKFVQMRIKLGPTLSSGAVQITADGTPLVRRLDFAFPTHPDATRMDQFLLGDDTLVAPVDPFPNVPKPPANPKVFNRSRSVWIPPGEWTSAFSGETLTGRL
jgi:alpha-glucosidase (family GH31 glycosyl hydrolase)